MKSSYVGFCVGMDEFKADAFVNRDEPIPLIAIPGTSDTPSSDATKRKRERLKDTLSGSKERLKDKFNMHDAGSGSKDSGYSLQDRLFTK